MLVPATIAWLPKSVMGTMSSMAATDVTRLILRAPARTPSSTCRGGRAGSSDIGSDTIRNIENVIAGGGDDKIFASDARNELTGGDGDDVFVFRTVASIGRGGSRDKIMDFEAGDRIDLDDIAKGLEDVIDNVFRMPRSAGSC